MNEWMQEAHWRWSENWKDYALSRGIFVLLTTCAIGGIDYARGGWHPFFLYVGFLGVLAIAALVVGFITRRAVLAVVHAVTRRSKSAS